MWNLQKQTELNNDVKMSEVKHSIYRKCENSNIDATRDNNRRHSATSNGNHNKNKHKTVNKKAQTEQSEEECCCSKRAAAQVKRWNRKKNKSETEQQDGGGGGVLSWHQAIHFCQKGEPKSKKTKTKKAKETLQRKKGIYTKIKLKKNAFRMFKKNVRKQNTDGRSVVISAAAYTNICGFRY